MKNTRPGGDTGLRRRTLVQGGAAGLATVAFHGWLNAWAFVHAATTAQTPDREEPPRDVLEFNDEVVAIAFGEDAREPFVLNGTLTVNRRSDLRGRVTVTFPDQPTDRFASSGILR